MTIADKKSNMDKRINQRRPYSGEIFFVGKNGFNEGWLKDFSRSGLFIITEGQSFRRRNHYHRLTVLEK